MNNIIIVSGASGSGKSTLIKLLLNKYTDLNFSVSFTSREKRNGEIDGRDYYFISSDEFKKKINQKEFVEWAWVHDQLYGTSNSEIEAKSRNGKTIILDIDVRGTKTFKKRFPDACYIFIIPPEFSELKRRLIRRDSDFNNIIENRLRIAKQELTNYSMYNYIIVNDDKEKAFKVLESILIAFNCSTEKMAPLVERIISE